MGLLVGLQEPGLGEAAATAMAAAGEVGLVGLSPQVAQQRRPREKAAAAAFNIATKHRLRLLCVKPKK